MPRLTYRGIVYQPSEKKSSKLDRVNGLAHTYRGANYHYESVEKEKDSYLKQY
jgi:hypothetical protein